MASIIKVTPDKNGRAIISLFSQEFDVTNIADRNGRGKLKAFGEEYEFQIMSKTRKRIAEIMEKSEEPVEMDAQEDKNEA